MAIDDPTDLLSNALSHPWLNKWLCLFIHWVTDPMCLSSLSHIVDSIMITSSKHITKQVILNRPDVNIQGLLDSSLALKIAFTCLVLLGFLVYMVVDVCYIFFIHMNVLMDVVIIVVVKYYSDKLNGSWTQKIKWLLLIGSVSVSLKNKGVECYFRLIRGCPWNLPKKKRVK